MAGHEGITKDRQELGKKETDLAQAQQTVQHIQQSASQAGVSEDQWQMILSTAQATAEKWQSWSSYPADLRDELLQLNAQYIPLSRNIASQSQEISEIEEQTNSTYNSN